MAVQTEIVKYNSATYWQCVALRDKILRQPLNLQFSKEELQAEYQQIHFAVKQNENIVACLSLVPQNNGQIKMRQVCVDTTVQTQGLGKLIVANAEKWAKENNYTQMYCHARESACIFYEKLHYVKKGKMFVEVGIPHYKMEKDL